MLHWHQKHFMKTLSDSWSSWHPHAPQSGDRIWMQRHVAWQRGKKTTNQCGV
jgi:hypothetical protein